jgi:exosortase A
MDAPVLAPPGVSLLAPPTASSWRRLLWALGVGVLVLGALFPQETAAAVRTWVASTAYNHCFLVIPIVAYLLWDRRDSFAGVQPQPWPAAALLGLPVAAAWLVAERLGIMEGRQLAAVSFAELLFLGLLGPRLWWLLSGPLLYLYFLVPVGEFLTPRLQDVTTFFVRLGLGVLGVPAFIDGYTIEIPQGTFFVAEACAGLRFLIASVAFGCLYALLMYRSPLRRGAFILASLLVPILANGVRALGIVYLGYLLNSAQAATADHIIYGWVFFSLVILMLIGLGLPFRQDLQPATIHPRQHVAGTGPSLRSAFAAATAVAAVAAVAPALAGGLSVAAGRTAAAPAIIDPGAGCIVRAAVADGPVHSERVQCGGDLPMDVAWQTFPSRSTAAPIMAARHRLTLRALSESAASSWLHAGPGHPSAWQILTSNDPVYVTAVAIWVRGRPVRPGLAMRLAMASDSLFGGRQQPMLITATPVTDWGAVLPGGRARIEAELKAFLSGHPHLGPSPAAP